jgi:hypothetical protein
MPQHGGGGATLVPVSLSSSSLISLPRPRLRRMVR